MGHAYLLTLALIIRSGNLGHNSGANVGICRGRRIGSGDRRAT